MNTRYSKNIVIDFFCIVCWFYISLLRKYCFDNVIFS